MTATITATAGRTYAARLTYDDGSPEYRVWITFEHGLWYVNRSDAPPYDADDRADAIQIFAMLIAGQIQADIQNGHT